PAAVLLPPVAAYAARGWAASARRREEAGRGRTGRRLVRAGAVSLLVALVVGAAVWVPLWERQRSRASGRAAGGAVAAAIVRDAPADGTPVILWADEMIEARPEVLLYAAREAAAAGRGLRPVWAKHAMERGELPPP